jgi:uncharacterized protein YjbI with pentapeptide repeats
MANEGHLRILEQGVKVWNTWRREHPGIEPDLTGVNLSEAHLSAVDFSHVDLSGADIADAWFSKAVFKDANLSKVEARRANFMDADLSGAILRGATLASAFMPKVLLSTADLSGANLNLANLEDADFSGATMHGTLLREATLFRASLRGADLREAQFSDAKLCGVDFRGTSLEGGLLAGADLSGANLTGVVLRGAVLWRTMLIGTRLGGADLTGAEVYGCAAWDIDSDDETVQDNLVITEAFTPEITVDGLEVAQFLYLILNNKTLNSILDTVTSKVVLILGRFSEQRKKVLDALREELRRHDYVPVIFDFSKPVDKSIADTVTTLARLARFVIADVTDPSWVTVEAQLIVRECCSIPFRLIKHESAAVPSPINDLRPDSPQLIKPFDYRSLDHAVASVKSIVEPAEEMAEKIRRKRKAIEDDPW